MMRKKNDVKASNDVCFFFNRHDLRAKFFFNMKFFNTPLMMMIMMISRFFFLFQIHIEKRFKFFFLFCFALQESVSNKFLILAIIMNFNVLIHNLQWHWNNFIVILVLFWIIFVIVFCLSLSHSLYLTENLIWLIASKLICLNDDVIID